MVTLPDIIYCKFHRERGFKNYFFKEKYDPKLEFPEGWWEEERGRGSNQKKPFGRGADIFWNIYIGIMAYLS